MIVSVVLHMGLFLAFALQKKPTLLRTSPVAVGVTLVEVGPDYKETPAELIETSEHRVTSHHVRPSPHIHAVETPASTQHESPATHPEPSSATQAANLNPGVSGNGSAVAGYLQTIVQIVASHRNYPTLAIDRNIEGRVVVEVTILADGTIQSTSVKSAAPYDILNGAALGIFRRIQKFPAPPPEFSSPVQLEVPIQYVINRK